MPKNPNKLSRENLLEHLIEKQLNELQLTTIDAIFEPKWRDKWTLTKEEHEKWKKYCISTMSKILKCNKKKVKESFEWLNQTYGLKIK